MDLMSKRSPSASVSPPISPIKLFNQPGSSLPPLKNLPVWNRPGLEKNRFIRSITKDSPELGKAELFLNHLSSKSTQTSPPGTAINGSNFHFSGQGPNFSGKDEFSHHGSSQPADKRLYFVQTEHENVLRKLHEEIDKLKSENKDLTFKFVMTRNGISISPEGASGPSIRDLKSTNEKHSSSATKRSAKNRDQTNERRKDSSAKDSNNDKKSRFKSGGARRPVQNDRQFQRVGNESKSAKYHTAHLIDDNIGSSERKLTHHSSFKSETAFEHQHAPDGFHSSSRDVTLSASDYKKKYSSDDYEEIIKGLQKMNARQANELNQLRDKLVEQKTKSEFEELRIYPENHLPKLAMRNASRSAKVPTVMRKKHEILTLPALRPHKLGNANRQRKAQSTQRQKLTKEYVQKLT